jgi:hypothetical protein
MESAKRAAIDLIRQLPDDTSLEDIQYHLYVRENPVVSTLQSVELHWLRYARLRAPAQ